MTTTTAPQSSHLFIGLLPDGPVGAADGGVGEPAGGVGASGVGGVCVGGV